MAKKKKIKNIPLSESLVSDRMASPEEIARFLKNRAASAKVARGKEAVVKVKYSYDNYREDMYGESPDPHQALWQEDITPETISQIEYEDIIDEITREGKFSQVLENEEYKELLKAGEYSKGLISKDFLEARNRQNIPTEVLGEKWYKELIRQKAWSRGLIKEEFAPVIRITNGLDRLDVFINRVEQKMAEMSGEVPGSYLEATNKKIPKGLSSYTGGLKGTPEHLRLEDWDPTGLSLNQAGLDILEGKNTGWSADAVDYLQARYERQLSKMSIRDQKKVAARFKSYYTVDDGIAKGDPGSRDITSLIEDLSEEEFGNLATEKEVAGLVGEGRLSYRNVLDTERVTPKELQFLPADLARVHSGTGALVGRKRAAEVGGLARIGERTWYYPGTDAETQFFERILPEGSATPFRLEDINLSGNPSEPRRQRFLSTPRSAALRREMAREEVFIRNRAKEITAERIRRASLAVPVGDVIPVRRGKRQKWVESFKRRQRSKGRMSSQASDALTAANEYITGERFYYGATGATVLAPDRVRPRALAKETIKPMDLSGKHPPLTFKPYLLSERAARDKDLARWMAKHPEATHGVEVLMKGKPIGSIPYPQTGEVGGKFEGKMGGLINDIVEGGGAIGKARGGVSKKGLPYVNVAMQSKTLEGEYRKPRGFNLAGTKSNPLYRSNIEELFLGKSPKTEAASQEAVNVSSKMTSRASKTPDKLSQVESEKMVSSAGRKIGVLEPESLSSRLAGWKMSKNLKTVALMGGIALSSYIVGRSQSREPSVGTPGETASKSLYGGVSGKVLYPEGMEEAQRSQNISDVTQMPSSYAARVQDPSSYQTNIRIHGNTKYKSDYAAVGNALGQMLASEHGAGVAKVNVRSSDNSRKMNDEHIKRKVERLIYNG